MLAGHAAGATSKCLNKMSLKQLSSISTGLLVRYAACAVSAYGKACCEVFFVCLLLITLNSDNELTFWTSE